LNKTTCYMVHVCHLRHRRCGDHGHCQHIKAHQSGKRGCPPRPYQAEANQHVLHRTTAQTDPNRAESRAEAMERLAGSRTGGVELRALQVVNAKALEPVYFRLPKQQLPIQGSATEGEMHILEDFRPQNRWDSRIIRWFAVHAQ
jgi:hypothetical protein